MPKQIFIVEIETRVADFSIGEVEHLIRSHTPPGEQVTVTEVEEAEMPTRADYSYNDKWVVSRAPAQG
jgi:hypothetical protein